MNRFSSSQDDEERGGIVFPQVVIVEANEPKEEEHPECRFRSSRVVVLGDRRYSPRPRALLSRPLFPVDSEQTRTQ